eukprot:CAMPEP_0204301608 /NCGR_PEP_ID=MMETSP0468-20130131/80706_1 /ASSEMBLY_ACC=CAM_ASM_000383 /TAXON_ID=2969 /ORGANISM="Oxyrrhis marina" /LENGTH=115 /DNA_ID=CAMNT_0051280763 /DNA_START=56 /DNA_END=399 /DNA_ORIENTATION=-
MISHPLSRSAAISMSPVVASPSESLSDSSELESPPRRQRTKHDPTPQAPTASAPSPTATIVESGAHNVAAAVQATARADNAAQSSAAPRPPITRPGHPPRSSKNNPTVNMTNRAA